MSIDIQYIETRQFRHVYPKRGVYTHEREIIPELVVRAGYSLENDSSILPAPLGLLPYLKL